EARRGATEGWVMKVWKSLAGGAALAALVLGAADAQVAPPAADSPFTAQATAAGAQGGTVTPRADGGALINGRLDGRQFAVAIPKAWNHQSLVFAHGYSTPDSSVDVA